MEPKEFDGTEYHKKFHLKKFLVLKFIIDSGGKLTESELVTVFGKKINVGKLPKIVTIDPRNPSSIVATLNHYRRRDWLHSTGGRKEPKVWHITKTGTQHYKYNKSRLEMEFGGIEGLVNYIYARRKFRTEQEKGLKVDPSIINVET